MMNITMACLTCRKPYRVPVQAHSTLTCRQCGRPCHIIGEAPAQADIAAWEALRQRIFCWQTSLIHEFYRQSSALETKYLQTRWESRKELNARQLRKLQRKTARARKKLRSTLCGLNTAH